MNGTTNRKKIGAIAYTAVFTALVFVFTMLVNIKWPFGNGGLIHLGNVPLFICAILLGKKTGAVAGAVGMGLFDLISGWVLWAPFTFVIVGLMGFTTGAITERKKTILRCVISLAAALVIKVAGYYIAEWVIYGNPIAPLQSVPGNIIQIGLASVLVLIAIKPLSAAAKRAGVANV
jgi:uncharacterized membrane protein